ncbi:MAG: DUF917 domain-containing protein [Pseudomonadota bacterium]
MLIEADDLDDLTTGAVFLATGGGGDPYVTLLATREVLRRYGPATLIKPEALDDDALVVTIGGVGAPTVGLELLPSENDVLVTLEAFEQRMGRTVDAVVSFEVGGGNSLIPIMAAAARGIPCVDGDGMGRALPEAQMMTYAIAGVSPTPAVAVDYAGNRVTFDTDNTHTYERHIRAMAQAMGGMITAAEHPMTGAELKAAIVPSTITFSILLGRVLNAKHANAVAAIGAMAPLFRDSIYGELHHLFTGKVVDYSSRVEGGFDVGTAIVESFDGEGPTLELAVKNEFLVATIDGKVLASVPDLITILDFETAKPINAERLRFGQRVSVVAVGCPSHYRTTKALSVVAPRAFGFDLDYHPVESLVDGHQLPPD